jgi:glycogen debranching enzyme
MLQKIKGPRGEEFEVISSEAAIRILNEGVPFIAAGVGIKKLVVKEGEVFLYTDVQGNIPRGNTYGLGLYFKDTRFLNILELYIDGKSPLLLSSSAELDYRASIELTNPDITGAEGKVIVPQETLNIRRLRVIRDNLYERIRVKNYNLFPVEVKLQLVLGADFFDVFEVRGLRRIRRGQILKPKYDGRALSMAYFGLDDVFRQTRIECWPQPTTWQTGPEGAQITYHLSMKPHETRIMNLAIKPIVGTERRKTYSLDTVSSFLRQSYNEWEVSSAKITTDNELFNSILERSERDIRQLITPTTHGTILVAGIPWFVAPFGRDALITSLETLMLNTYPAYESLKMLASLQGKEVDQMRDEEPGKIFHEIRQGELTNLNEVPYTPYYGSADATPLFLIVVSELFKWTGDIAFLNTMLDPIERALRWIDDFGDRDGDLFVEYLRKSPRGLINQGWKDSGGAVCHKDGTKAAPPIAVAEVQGYVYRAKKDIAEVYSFLGQEDLATKLNREAEALKERFNKMFWMDERACFAMALDKDKKKVETITSNAGQCLFGGIADDKKAKKLVERLMQPDMFSGWGIRTLSKGASNYNPMSYHGGTVWPHDNAIIVWGFKQYGFTTEALKIVSGLFDATITFDYLRLPELFCGFSRRSPHPPVGYPVSCAPQAWAAGSIFFALQTMLGLRADAPKNTLYVNPTLPRWLNEVKVEDLKVGEARLSILFTRIGEETLYKVLKKPTGFKVLRENKVGGFK